jgi:FAD:protein FMN transferase
MCATSFEGRQGPSRIEQIMGMPIIIEVRDPDVDPAALDRAFDWLRWVDATFSTYKPDSEICRLNRGELALVEAHSDVRAVLARCEQVREETGGYFDARAPFLLQPAGGEGSPAPTAAPVDPSGLVKGWSVERAALILEAAGALNYYINAGGDIRVRGRPVITQPYWRIGIQHPLQRDRIAAVIAAADLAIATSGAYERGEHILDPHTGRPPSGVLSVTIVGPDLALADAYATAAFAMGEAGPPWTARLRGYQAMTIRADGVVLSTMGFPSIEDEPADDSPD